MDKLMDSPWFIKIISLLLALLLYTSVPHTGSSSLDVYVPGDQTTATITSVPVKAYFDTSNLAITGIPTTVKVALSGPTSLVQQTKTLKDFEVYVDLTKAKIGNQTVTLKIRNLSDKLKATVEPSSITVNVQEKITKSFNVTAEYNSSLIPNGYTADQAVVEPNTVNITGPKDVVDSITYVKANVYLSQYIFDTTTKEATVQAFDRDLNKVDVDINPTTVSVTIPVRNTSKTVPINIVQTGTPQAGISIDSISLDKNQAVISGSSDMLKATDHVRVEVDVSKITSDTTLSLPVIIPNGITSVSPQLVQATVKVSKTGTSQTASNSTQQTISGIPITTQGLSNQFQVQFNDPASQTINLVVNGPSAKVNALTANDFKAYVDLSNLAVGSHNVTIQINGPSGVNWSTDKSTAAITITKP